MSVFHMLIRPGLVVRNAQREHRCRESRSTRWRPVGLCHAVVGQWSLELRFSKICRGSSLGRPSSTSPGRRTKSMNRLRDTGMPIVAVTTREARSGKLRKNPVMRVTDGSTGLSSLVPIRLRCGPVLGPQEAVQPASDVVANRRVAQRSARASRAARRPASTAPSM
jgi:hypothetical protein